MFFVTNRMMGEGMGMGGKTVDLGNGFVLPADARAAKLAAGLGGPFGTGAGTASLFGEVSSAAGEGAGACTGAVWPSAVHRWDPHAKRKARLRRERAELEVDDDEEAKCPLVMSDPEYWYLPGNLYHTGD